MKKNNTIRLCKPPGFDLSLILDGLEKAQPHAGTSSAAVYVNQILHAIHHIDEQTPDDPMLNVLYALYDALAHNGRWAGCTADQYEKAGRIVRRLAGLPVIKPEQTEKAITELEAAGFETMPYSITMQEEA